MSKAPARLGKYETLEEIGRGGFAVVYKARDTRLDRVVALKVITGKPAQEPDVIARFRQEVRTAANLRHPHIVTVHDFDVTDDALYLAMTLIEGRTLRQCLNERGHLTLDGALPILSQLADALDYLHDQGHVHRDVKPSNVMLEREDHDPWVTLTDFGLVRTLETSTVLTQTVGSILGTPAYLAPEQADPDKWGQVTPLTDVYALGVITYEMLVGRRPFECEGVALINAQANKPPTPPLELAPDLDEDLSAALLRALAKPPAERYPGAGALVETLRQIAEARARQERQETELTHLLLQFNKIIRILIRYPYMARIEQKCRFGPYLGISW
jgi:serine/threonine protein kinase